MKKIIYHIANLFPSDNPIFNFIRFCKLKKLYKNNLHLIKNNTMNSNSNHINDYEFSVFSQHGEDGILNFIFDKIGFTNKKSVEIGVGYSENNSLYLISKFNLSALLIDGSSYNTKIFNHFNKKFLKTNSIAINRWITKSNVNQIISEKIKDKEIDFLSIDIDGNDYWIWDAIKCVNPRVVVIEYNASFCHHSITTPYDDNFNRSKFPHKPNNQLWYHGASLTALNKLALQKGYILIGTDSSGVNAFFVKKNITEKFSLKAMTTKEAFKSHLSRSKGILTNKVLTSEQQFNYIKDFNFIHV